MRTRPLLPLAELYGYLEEAGVTDAPREAPDDAHLQGLLSMALHVAECQKRVRFPDFTWAEPSFVAEDARVTLRFHYARLTDKTQDDLRTFLLDSMARVAGANHLLAVDTRPSGIAEFELAHHLYGEVTLFQHRSRPSEPADLRIHQARERGWTPTLKENNLLPGRGLVVLDEHQGLLLREPWLDALPGLLVLLASGETKLLWNPFSREADAEWQYWLAWGAGAGAPSEWRQVLHVSERDDLV